MLDFEQARVSTLQQREQELSGQERQLRQQRIDTNARLQVRPSFCDAKFPGQFFFIEFPDPLK
jgi:hypothetical protein